VDRPHELAERLLGAAEAFRLLGVSRATLYRLVRGGALKSIRISNAVRFEARQLAEYLERQRN
jgi:excisionase family DNA binding protein